MTDKQRPGQRIVNYARFVAKVPESGRVSPLEIWLWNLSQKEFDKVMKWRLE